MKICKNCVLPETFPGVSLDGSGLCIHCRQQKDADHLDHLKKRYEQKFLGILDERRDKGRYDALVAFSGGKDSTYTLKLLKDNYNLKVMAVTFDHGFLSEAAKKNIQMVTSFLNVDQLTVCPGKKSICELFVRSMDSDLYPIKSLERASSICNSCMNVVKNYILKSAIEMRVPLVVYGWSPGQAPVQSSVLKMSPSMLRQAHNATVRIIKKLAGDSLTAFFLQDFHFESKHVPYFIHPLAFLYYNEADILDTIRDIGWVNPKDTDANSTNCLLNSFANQIHIQRFGFHPYAFEIAGMVRDGYMDREEGLEKLEAESDSAVVEYVKRKLGLLPCD